MRVTKCDICKKIIKDDSKNVHVAVGRSMLSDYHEICATCGKPVLDFLKKKKLIEGEKEKNKK